MADLDLLLKVFNVFNGQIQHICSVCLLRRETPEEAQKCQAILQKDRVHME